MPFLKSMKFRSEGREYRLTIDKGKNGVKSLEIVKVDSDQRIVINENDIDDLLESINQLMPNSKFDPPPLPQSVPPPETKYKQTSVNSTEKKSKTKTFAEIRKTYPNAYYPWEEKDDEKLERLFNEGLTTKELSNIFGRNRGAIRSRLRKLGLID